MRTPFNPYGGVNPLIDKMIGNAYDIVKYVARYLKEIRYVAENMESIYDAVHGYRYLLTGNPGGSTSLALPLPGNVQAYNINSITVLAVNGDTLWTPGPDTFNFGIAGGQVVISIDDSVEDLLYAEYRCQISTLFPSQSED